MKEFGTLIRIVAQERFSRDEFKTVKLIAELEMEKYDASEREAHIEDIPARFILLTGISNFYFSLPE